jgi:hypothetical protein
MAVSLEALTTIAYDGSGGQLEPDDLEAVFRDLWASHRALTAGLQMPSRESIDYRNSWGGVHLTDALELVATAVKGSGATPAAPPRTPASPPRTPEPPLAPPPVEARALDRNKAVDDACAYLARTIDEDHGGQVPAEDLARLFDLVRQGVAPFLRTPDAAAIEARSSWGGVYTADALDLLRENT